ncbi:MAG: hypothetical protein RBR59_03800 [Sulfurimonadaceae bacterium]|jgi:hypothetical protein|nr:hypothetical protein [Sulfurimonadaceae bacterium]
MLGIRFITQIFILLLLTQSLLFSALTVCPGDTLTALDGATEDASSSINNKAITASTKHFYSFTSGVDGFLNISAYMDKTNNNLYVYKVDCSSPFLSNTSQVYSKSFSNIPVKANERIIIEYERYYTTNATYSLTVTFKKKGGRDFEQRTQYNLFGDVKVIGNTVLCILKDGECIEPTSTTNSNADTDLQKSPRSFSTLTIPENAIIEYARIYWQGRLKATTTNDAWDSASRTAATTIDIRKGDTGTYTSLSADIQDFDSTSSNNYVRIYSASADALSVVNGSGEYYINPTTFYTHAGKTNGDSPSDGLGAYGAWVLVVIYNDPDEPKARNITIFDGYTQVTKDTGNIDVSVAGFLTPKTGEVDSKTYVFTGEGDKYLTKNGDVIKMAGLTYNTTLQTLGTFDSRIDVDGVRNPSLTNNNGIDIHKYDTGTTSGAKNIIATNEVGAKFQFTSDQDTYFPSLIVFSTQLYLPQLCYDYSIKQDGYYLDVDRVNYPIAQLSGRISASPLDVVIYLRNNEADVKAQGLSITTTTQKKDENGTLVSIEGTTAQFYEPDGNILTSNTNGSALLDRGNPTSVTDLIYDKDGNNLVSNNGLKYSHDIRKGLGTLDAGDYVYMKYSLKPYPDAITGLTDINVSLGLSLNYFIEAFGSGKIEYPPYILGSQNVPLCEPTGSYEPTWGQFNVVQRALKTNNLHTQISRKPFDVDVIFDATPATGTNDAPSTDITTTVLVEMIDIDAFGDINASCANPDSALTMPIAVPLNFTGSNYQSEVPTQSAEYYNFAVKNGAFRVWFFVDQNDSLIQDWTASTSNDGTLINNISGLYKSAKHTECASVCSDASSAACFDCIKNNYALSLCSRDNFSVRPESYDISIYDVNQTLPQYKINTDPTNIKNTTKLPLTSNTGALQKNQLAAGYMYRFDIAATGNDSTDHVPGYTREFNKGTGYTAKLKWEPTIAVTSGCNDSTNRDVNFYVANGQMLNEEEEHSQVGDYILQLRDISWTAVDATLLSHHAKAGFLPGQDCLPNISSTTGPMHGCEITSDHPNGGAGIPYKDQDLTFHPFKFDISSVGFSFGLDNQAPIMNSFVYNNDIASYVTTLENIQKNMSVHYQGNIVARGYNDTMLTNFVAQCYSKDLNISLGTLNLAHNDTNGNAVPYKYRLHNRDNAGDPIGSEDINNTNIVSNSNISIQVPSSYFKQNQTGSLNTRLNMNYHKSVNQTVNPKIVTYPSTFVEVKCITPGNCGFNAKSTTMAVNSNNLKEGEIAPTINDLNITHYYGRSFVDKQRYPGQVGVAPLKYEVYCNRTQGCTLLLFAGTKISLGGDFNWYINEGHNITNDGNVTEVTQKSGGARVLATEITADTISLQYDGSRGFPYATTMRHRPDTWLIYNKNNANATANEFDVEFIQGQDGSWAGKHETNSETNTTAAPVTNRRTMW